MKELKGSLTYSIFISVWSAFLFLYSSAKAEYPQKPVEYVIPFGAGGESDLAARLQQSVFKTLTGQDLVLKYRPGGGGAVAWSQINSMSNDGYVITGINFPHILLQPLRGAKYKTEELAILHIFHYTPHAIFVRKKSQYKKLADLINMMKAKPGRVVYSGSGRGTANHLAQVWFDKQLHTNSVYKSHKGTAAAISTLLNEQVDASWAYTTVAIQYSNEVRMLAVAMHNRHPQFADVPTFRELGYELVGGAYRGIAVPKTVPRETQVKISKVFGKINNHPGYTSRKSKLGFVPLSIHIDEIPDFIKSRQQEYLAIARQVGLID